MKEQNRVLGRVGARELAASEVEQVTASFKIRTTTLCSAPRPTNPVPDGDVGEC